MYAHLLKSIHNYTRYINYAIIGPIYAHNFALFGVQRFGPVVSEHKIIGENKLSHVFVRPSEL